MIDKVDSVWSWFLLLKTSNRSLIFVIHEVSYNLKGLIAPRVGLCHTFSAFMSLTASALLHSGNVKGVKKGIAKCAGLDQ